jgi:hypothetical protein
VPVSLVGREVSVRLTPLEVIVTSSWSKTLLYACYVGSPPLWMQVRWHITRTAWMWSCTMARQMHLDRGKGPSNHEIPFPWIPLAHLRLPTFSLQLRK